MKHNFFKEQITPKSSRQLRELDNISLQAFECCNSHGTLISLVVAMRSNQIPKNGAQVNFNDFKDDIIMTKQGSLSAKDIQDSIEFFENKYQKISPDTSSQ